jgi:hypothetical protein
VRRHLGHVLDQQQPDSLSCHLVFVIASSEFHSASR